MIRHCMQKLEKNANDVKTRLQIAMIYLSEARITGEHPYYYPAILKILDGILYLNPNNFEAVIRIFSINFFYFKHPIGNL